MSDAFDPIVERDKKFEPFWLFNKDGDCIEAFISSEEYHAERLNGPVTVYRSERTGQIIGILLKGVRQQIEPEIERLRAENAKLQSDLIECEKDLFQRVGYFESEIERRRAEKAKLRKILSDVAHIAFTESACRIRSERGAWEWWIERTTGSVSILEAFDLLGVKYEKHPERDWWRLLPPKEDA